MTQQQTTAMTTSTEKKLTPRQIADREIKEFLNRPGTITALKQIASKYITAERLVSIALIARAKTPELAKCSKESILTSLMQASEMGLEPNTPLQHAALIPRQSKKTGMLECQFMPMYRGLIVLAKRCEVAKAMRATPIYSCDEWKITEGLERNIEHVPAFEHSDYGDPQKVVAVYAVAELVDGTREWTYMTRAQIERIRMRAAARTGPWTTDWEEMAKKTVIRRLFKLLPITSNDMGDAIAKTDELDPIDLDMSAIAEAAEAQVGADESQEVIDAEAVEALPPGDTGAALAAEIAKGAKGKKVEAAQGKLVE